MQARVQPAAPSAFLIGAATLSRSVGLTDPLAALLGRGLWPTMPRARALIYPATWGASWCSFGLPKVRCRIFACRSSIGTGGIESSFFLQRQCAETHAIPAPCYLCPFKPVSAILTALPSSCNFCRSFEDDRSVSAFKMAGSAAGRAPRSIMSKKVVLDDFLAVFDHLWCIWKGTSTVLSMCPSAMRDVCDVTRERGARVSEAMVRKCCIIFWIMLRNAKKSVFSI